MDYNDQTNLVIIEHLNTSVDTFIWKTNLLPGTEAIMGDQFNRLLQGWWLIQAVKNVVQLFHEK